MRLLNKLKKFLVLFSTAAIISLLNFANLHAEGEGGSSSGGSSSQMEVYLQQISSNTYNILSAVNSLPEYLNALSKVTISWLTDDSGTTDSTHPSFTMQTQGNFASLGSAFSKNTLAQNDLALQQQLTAALFQQSASALKSSGDKPAQILTSLPYANDLAYPTTLGIPPVEKGSGSALNYVRYASGFSMIHPIPSPSWAGKQMDKDRYKNYFNTITAVGSFDSYALSQLIADNANGNKITPVQNDLIVQASQSDWLAQIATEELGKVLRQILLFESQSYILLTQLLQVERQQLTAQVMTNTLLIATNQSDESQMLTKALGLPTTIAA